MVERRDIVDLDARDDLRRGREPMTRILAAARSLEPGQSLRLRATFEPIPLFKVLASMGLDHEAHRLAEGDWQVTFRHRAGGGEIARRAQSGEPSGTPRPEPEGWPEASRSLDNRGLTPPEPMMRVLEALENLGPGAVLEVFNDREPAFLYPELEARGVVARSEPLARGVRLLLRKPEEDL